MGKIEFDHNGSGSGITLSSDGTDLLLNGTAIGGGGASALTIDAKTAAYTVVAGDLGKVINCTTGTFTVSLTAAATLGAGFYCWVWNTGNSASGIITIDPDASETIDSLSTIKLYRNQAVKIVCDGTNFRTEDLLQTPFNANFSTGNMNNQATGDSSIAIGDTVTASGTFSIAMGRSANANINYAMALGANAQAVGDTSTAIQDSYASGTDSLAAAITNNTSTYGATGTNSVAIGYRSKASLSYGFACGYQNIASGFYSVALGRNSTAAGPQGFAAGYLAEAAQDNTVALGFRPKADTDGKFAFAAGVFAATGDAQTGTFVLRSDTTDATAEALTTNNSTAGTTNQIVLPNNSVYGFTGTVIAREDSASTNDFAVWEIKGGAVRAASAATTTLGSYNINKISESTGAANWSIALSADTTNGAVAITVTGEAAHNIRWVATVNTTEVTY